MLSSVADNLYWMSRYLERAEHTARLLDVNVHGALEGTPEGARQRWERLSTSLRIPLTGPTLDGRSITQICALDTANPESIVSCIASARDNAREAWEQISSEMWEQINRLYLFVSKTNIDDIYRGEPHAFFAAIKQGAHLFQGIADSTMSHGEGWQFIGVGRGIERATATTNLLGAYFTPEAADPEGESPAYLEWVGLLKSCTAFEAYVKCYSADIQPRGIAEFLLLNTEFPRSVRFVCASIKSGLGAIGRTIETRGSARPERLAGRLLASLEFNQIDEIMAGDFQEYLEYIRQECEHIHVAIYGTFIRYPVAAALATRDRSV
jgi:uncharacterized alpha-E superfamily protein